MKTLFGVVTAGLLAIYGPSAIANAVSNMNAQESHAQTEANPDYDDNEPIDGQYFSSDCVTQEYEDGMRFYVRYTDPDAAMDEAEIELTVQAFCDVFSAIRNGEEITGTLTQTESGAYDITALED